MIPRHMAADPVTFEVDAGAVRDLNGNGPARRLRGPRRPIEERVNDLLARMTLVEKAA